MNYLILKKTSLAGTQETNSNKLSCALCRGNARMCDRSVISVVRGVGSGFMPGLGRAVDTGGNVQSRPSSDCCPFV